MFKSHFVMKHIAVTDLAKPENEQFRNACAMLLNVMPGAVSSCFGTILEKKRKIPYKCMRNKSRLMCENIRMQAAPRTLQVANWHHPIQQGTLGTPDSGLLKT